MYLKLIRPLVALDVETHAKVVPERARICELGFHICYPDDQPSKEWSSFIQPEVPIEADATEIHGITETDLIGAPTFKDIAGNLSKGFRNCDFLGYNIKFDLRVLAAEMARAEVAWNYDKAYLVDGLRLWQVMRPRTLTDAVREFLDREPTKAHRALEDAQDALAVTLAIGQRFDLSTSVAELHKLCFAQDPKFVDKSGKLLWVNGQATIGFGKHRGITLGLVPRAYLEWIVGSDFPEDTKQIIKNMLNGKPPQAK